MLSCVCVVSVLVWAPCGLKMKQFYTFWCHYVFSEGFASDGRKASRGSRNQVLAGLIVISYTPSFHIFLYYYFFALCSQDNHQHLGIPKRPSNRNCSRIHITSKIAGDNVRPTSLQYQLCTACTLCSYKAGGMEIEMRMERDAIPTLNPA